MTQASLSLTLTKKVAQPWLSSAPFDVGLIIAPALISSAVALIFQSQLNGSESLPLWAWVSFILLVDVAHVYATLFRTYFSERAHREHRFLLTAAPLLSWLTGCLLYSASDLYFWRALAYLAVFHFIRQQYGFMALYMRRDPENLAKYRWLDCAAIYAATGYPLIYWHTHMPRHFNWFIEGDFIETLPALFNNVGLAIYAIVAITHIGKELIAYRATGFFNIPKNLIVFATAVSWWVGIVALNSDIAFTMTNVLTHGIPYMALIWLYHHRSDDGSKVQAAPVKKRESAFALQTAPQTLADEGQPAICSESKRSGEETSISRSRQVLKLALTFAPAFIILLWLFAYLEEGLWDGFIWREHLALFLPFSYLPAVSDRAALAVLVPLLSLPQSTHYVLDGFIWRVKNRTSVWTA